MEPKMSIQWPDYRLPGDCNCMVGEGCGCRVTDYNEGVKDAIKAHQDFIKAQEQNMKAHFEQNMLDGEKVNDCGKSMLSAESVWEYIKENYSQAQVGGKFGLEYDWQVRDFFKVAMDDIHKGYLTADDLANMFISKFKPVDEKVGLNETMLTGFLYSRFDATFVDRLVEEDIIKNICARFVVRCPTVKDIDRVVSLKMSQLLYENEPDRNGVTASFIISDAIHALLIGRGR